MEGMESMAMENAEVAEERAVVLVDEDTVSCSNYEWSDCKGKDSAFCEKFLLDDLGLKVESQPTNSNVLQSYLDGSEGCNCIEHLGRLQITIGEKLQVLEGNLKGVTSPDKWAEINEGIDDLKVAVMLAFEQISSIFCSVKDSVSEQKWVHDIQRQIMSVLIQSFVTGLHNEFEAKLFEQGRVSNTLGTTWQKKAVELSMMREELDAISWSLSLEPGSLSSHSSFEFFEEQNTAKGRDNLYRNDFGNHHASSIVHPEENDNDLRDKTIHFPEPMMEVVDSTHLKHMTNEEVIAHCNNEIMKMRRQYDHALQDKTEELFKLKREFLKEKGSSHFKKDKDFDTLRRRIPEVISKLDEIFLENEKLSIVHDEVSGLNGIIANLLAENQHSWSLLEDRMKEINSLSSQVSDAAGQMSLHSSVEANLLKQIRKLKADAEDVEIEANIRDEICYSILKEMIGKHKCDMRDVLTRTVILQEIYPVVFGGVMTDAISTINSTISRYYMENSSLEAKLLKRDESLLFEMEENKKLKQTIISLSTMMKENDKFASDVGSELFQQKEHFDHEVGELIEQVSKQQLLISDKNVELDSVNSRLSETLKKSNQNEMVINRLNQRVKILSDSLDESDKENTLLLGIIEEKQRTLSSFITKDKDQAKKMKCIVTSMMEFSNTIADLENRFVHSIQRNESRLKKVCYQWTPLIQQVSLLREKELWYRQVLNLKSCNLQKAEDEVDLLGDEVDTLLSLLGKIYVALDHYSPVFELYPGVMDILKLVRRELKGDAMRLM